MSLEELLSFVLGNKKSENGSSVNVNEPDVAVTEKQQPLPIEKVDDTVTTVDMIRQPEVEADVVGIAIPEPSYYNHGGNRYRLIYEGVCTHCAHCGFKLTDSESIERGLGPICSKKGYFEDPKQEGDIVDLFVPLAKYPELVDYVTKRYKPQGNRGLVNALVRIASLNRRTPVHQAVCDAVDALGYTSLASLLRESLAVIEVKQSSIEPDNLVIWVKKSEFVNSYAHDMYRISGAHFARAEKGISFPKSARLQVWHILRRYYHGLVVKYENVARVIPEPVKKPDPSPSVDMTDAEYDPSYDDALTL